jgi:protein gp37
MGETTGIAWCDSTWNPIRGTSGNWACIRWSAGCENCYAETLNRRFGGPGFVAGADTPRLDERILEQPFRWKRPRKIFVCSMTDLFERRVPDEWLDRIFGVMLRASWHTYQLLTKRPERMREAVARWIALRQAIQYEARCLVPLPRSTLLPNHIWCGTSIEQDRWCGRADVLRQTPAAMRFISAEPLLEPLPSLSLTGIDWLIVGGESGPGPGDRKLVERCTHVYEDTGKVDRANCGLCHGTGWRVHPWARDEARRLQDLTHAAGGAYFLKQFGGPRPGSAGHLLDGVEYQEFPAVRGS